MKVFDVNVAVAAFREDHTHHGVAHPWLQALVGGSQSFGVPDLVWASFVRLSTNRRVFPTPAPLTEAFAFVRAVRAAPNHVAITPGSRHLDLLERVCHEGDATGDLVPDAQLAALAIELGAELVSFDRDFARFPGLRWTRLE